MNNVIIVLVLSSTLFFVNTTSGISTYNQCGQNLITLLSLVCRGQYNPPRDKKVPFKTEKLPSEKTFHEDNSLDKHNEFDIEYFLKQQLVDEFNREQAAAREQEMQAFLPFPFQNRINAYEMIPHRFRRQSGGGVVDECCSKACTLHELSGYCAN